MKRIATVGNFDGMHRGHLTVLDTLLNEGQRRGLQPLAITFSNHPLEIIAPDRAPRSLSTPEDKEKALKKYVGDGMMMQFTPDLCGMTAREWMRRMRDEMDVAAIVLGYDNTFGSDGRHLSQEDYRRIGAEEGLDVVIAPAVEGCSSSLARKAVAEGDITAATRILGRYYTLKGTVGRGDRIGTGIGIPTANLIPKPDMVIPPDGVYAAYVTLPDGELRQSVVDIGHRPSLNDNYSHQLRIEAHIPGWSGDIYDREISISFAGCIRDEKKFDGLPQLRAQIDEDIAQMRAMLSKSPMVSVVIPVYNGARYIADTIHSLRCQTRPDWEAIIVDDSSTDESYALLEQEAQGDSRIHIYRKPNERFACRGIAYAIPHCRGRFFQYMSQDDQLSADLFEQTLLTASRCREADAIVPRMRSWHGPSPEEGESTPFPGPEPGVCITGPEAFRLSLNWQIHGFPLLRMHLVKSLGIDKRYINSDEYDTRRQYYHSRAVCFSEGTFYYHTGNPDAVTRRWRPAMTGYIGCDAMLARFMADVGADDPSNRLEMGRRTADDAINVWRAARQAKATRRDLRPIAEAIAATRRIWNIPGVSRRMKLQLLTITNIFTILHPNCAQSLRQGAPPSCPHEG